MATPSQRHTLAVLVQANVPKSENVPPGMSILAAPLLKAVFAEQPRLREESHLITVAGGSESDLLLGFPDA